MKTNLLKNIIKYILILTQLVLPRWAFAQTAGAGADQVLTVSAHTPMISVSPDFIKYLRTIPSDTTIPFPLANGVDLEVIFKGFHNKSTGIACNDINDNSCIPLFEPTKKEILNFDDANSTDNDGISTSSADSSTATSKDGSFGLGTALGSGALAGAGAMAGIIFGDSAGLRDAENHYQQAANNLSNSLALQVQFCKQLQEAASNFIQNYESTKPVDIDSLVSVNQIQDPFSSAGMSQALNGLDPDYQQRAQDVVALINKNNDNFDLRTHNYQQIAKSAVLASIQSRHSGAIPVSEVQLKIAKQIALEVANLLYGLDPFTGLHRGIYELFTGRNLITGEQLTDFARGVSGGFAVLNLLSLGSSSVVTAAIKGIAAVDMAGMRAGVDALKESLQIMDGTVGTMAREGITDSNEIFKTEEAVNNDVRNGAIQNQNQLTQDIESSITEGKIRNVRARPEYIKNPASDESLTFIKNKVSSEKARATVIYQGNTKDIYIIGRKMGEIEGKVVVTPGVRSYEQELLEAGYTKDQVHIFEPTTAGKTEFGQATKGGTIQLHGPELEKTEMWRQNVNYIKKAIGTPEARPTVIDLGYSAVDPDTPASDFYNMEQEALVQSGRDQWNSK